MVTVPAARWTGTEPDSRQLPAQRYFSISQVAGLLGVSRMTVWRWIRAGRLPVVRLGHRTTRIRREDLDRLVLQAGAVAPDPTGAPDRGLVMATASGHFMPPSAGQDAAPTSHLVRFYETDDALVDAVGSYVEAGLQASQVCVVLATTAHHAALESRLGAVGVDVTALAAAGQYIALDAADTLAQIMVGGEPSSEAFADVVGTVIAEAGSSGRGVRAFGEMVGMLAMDRNHGAAIRLEALWNDLQQAYPFALYCAYPMAAFGDADFAGAFDEITAGHSRVVPAESYPALASEDDRLRAVAALQQQAASLAADVAERRRAEERLRQSEQQLRDFVENATEGLHWVGPDGRVLWVNRAELELLGYTEEEYIGHSIAEFHADADVVEDILRRLSSGESLYGYEARLRAKDGSIRFVLLNSSVYRENGQFVHTRCFTRDITERKLAELEREALLERERAIRAEAEAALRVRDEFVSIAAHELRTPLTTLKAHADVALRRVARAGQLEPQRAIEALGTIASQSDKLSRLLGHLLDVSRLEAGKLTLERRPTDLAALSRQIVDAAQARSEHHGIDLTAPETLVANVDPLRIEQVLVNLLDNASKYSPNGGSIEVAVSSVGEDSAKVAVRDHGLGIPPEKRAWMFERFYQAHGEGYRSGLGLGLYVSRQIVELHGGQISAEFPLDGGSEFTVRLPITCP
jgi:PAS domain S-box-containing protein/excisionase family DNA binding protein